MRLGYFGGTFDPPHRGHLAVALAAAQTFSLDRVLLAPTGRQPLKPTGSHAGFADRLAMVAELCREHVMLEPSALDAPRPDGRPNYTVETLAALRETLASTDELFLIIGADAFRELPHWREPQRLFQLTEFVVVSRPGLDLQSLIAQEFFAPFHDRIHLLTTVHEEVSATEIRACLEEHRDCSRWLTPGVLGYIHAHHLYEAQAVAHSPGLR